MQINVADFGIFKAHSETVNIQRQDAYSNRQRTVVVSGIECVLQPSGLMGGQGNTLELREGVGINQTEKIAILGTPNDLIKKGDFLITTDNKEFRVEDVWTVKNSGVMQLQLTSMSVA